VKLSGILLKIEKKSILKKVCGWILHSFFKLWIFLILGLHNFSMSFSWWEEKF
jgi:hypothetical protein